MNQHCPYCHEEIPLLEYSAHVAKHVELRPDGQHEEYATLPPEERSEGDLDGIPQWYRHDKCGGVTGMPEEIIRTYLRDPWFYNSYTFCTGCGKHVHQRELVWVDTEQRLDAYFAELKAANPDRRPGLFSRLLGTWGFVVAGIALFALLTWLGWIKL